jgi:activator of HSP90 ATPase
MKNSKSFFQSIVIKAKRSSVYDALTNGELFAKFTDAPAEIAPIVGSRFMAYGGYLNGFNLEIKNSEYLVQAWRTQDWGPGDYSLLRFTLSDQGTDSTRIDVYHYGIPNHHESSNEKVWDEFYWSKLRNSIEK